MLLGLVVAQLGEGLCYKLEDHRFDSRLSLEFFIDIISPSPSNRNEYQDYFLGVKTADAQGWQPYHLYVLKSGNLNLLVPPGPIQISTETALPLP